MKKYNFPLVILMFIIFLTTFSAPAIAREYDDNADKKVLLLVMDYIDTNDLLLAQTPNLDKLIMDSGTGLMNIRAKNRYPSSSYMSLAVGARVGTVNRAELSFNIDEAIYDLPNVFTSNQHYLTAGEFYQLFTGIKPAPASIVNLFSENIRKNSALYNPPYEMGQIGKIARNNNIAVAVLGNADTFDTLNRNIAILGMDENGIILQGDISSNTVSPDPLVAGGTKSNHAILLEKFRKLLANNQLLIIDLGDTTRVEISRFTTADEIVLRQRQAAIERNDDLIGNLISEVDPENTMILIVTPNPHKEMLSSKNFGLTPVIIYDPDKQGGLLTSATTRRAGLITNADVLPTIFTYLGADFIANGNQVSIIPAPNQIGILEDNLQTYKNLRTNRNPLHLLFIILILFSFALGLWTLRSQPPMQAAMHRVLNILIYGILSIPILWMFIGITGYKSVYISILFTLFISLVIGGLINLFLSPLRAIFLFTGLTSLLLTIDCFMNSKLMLLSPLGSDAIAGGRYYGIGNDFMGILLASSIIFITILVYHLNNNNYLRAALGGIFLLIVSLAIGHPSFGANVGGLITALVTSSIFILFITNRKLNWKTFALIGLLAVFGVILVARLDFLYSSNPSHAGMAINSLLSGGPQVFLSIVQTKLGILANTVYTSNWSIVMLVFLVFLIYVWVRGKERLALLAIRTPSMMTSVRILIISGLTVFVVNDTGVIAAALILTYTVICLWIGINEN